MNDRYLNKISSLVHDTIREINGIIKDSDNKEFVNKTISEISLKNNVNEAHIRRVMQIDEPDLKKKKKKEKAEIRKTFKKPALSIINDNFNGSVPAYHNFINKLKKHGLFESYSSLKTKQEKDAFVKENINKEFKKEGNINNNEKVIHEWNYDSFSNPKKYKGEKLRRLKGHPGYSISDHGRIFKGKKLMFVNYMKGINQHYTQIVKDKKRYTYFLHRLVAIYFINNPRNMPDVLFINGNSEDCRVQNLQWGYQNTVPGWNPETKQKGETALFCTKLTEQKVLEIYNASGSHESIAADYNITRTMVTHIKNGNRWKWLTQKKSVA